jgi:hypothetical protein
MEDPADDITSSSRQPSTPSGVRSLFQHLIGFLGQRVMVPEQAGYYVEGTDWPTGIKPAGMQVEETEELIDVTFKNYWEPGLTSLDERGSPGRPLRLISRA